MLGALIGQRLARLPSSAMRNWPFFISVIAAGRRAGWCILGVESQYLQLIDEIWRAILGRSRPLAKLAASCCSLSPEAARNARCCGPRFWVTFSAATAKS